MTHATANDLVEGAIVSGPNFAEPIEVLVVKAMGSMVKVIGRGTQTGQSHQLVLTAGQIAFLSITPKATAYDGDPVKFKLAIEAARLSLAYEYDPYFSLSIARVDPLPHQLEAVYEYFMRLPRIRFLLADDPGAGKTIMAGLLIKELKIRGLIKRILIIAPASLTFQWQREMKDKFREQFEVVRSDVLRANYGSNPWQEKNQLVTSVSWVSRVEDAKESLLRSRWDLVIVDEAHKMSAYSAEKKTLAYQLGEALSRMTDHFLLMTATPHKGDPENFSLFLQLLDRDVYGDVKSLEEAMENREAPFYLRRVKEALVTFPDPKTGQVQTLFTKRNVTTSEFQIASATAEAASAAEHPLPDDSVQAFVTDPPYYDAVPYADLSDFFYVWLRRSIGHLHPALFRDVRAPKSAEIVQLSERNPSYAAKTREHFETQMRQAMKEGRRILAPNAIGVVVFAHKTTTGWETQLQAMIEAGWVITGSWPIDTERPGRLRANNAAALASSVHLVCRPRENPDGSVRASDVGDWRDVLQELPRRIHEWMPRLSDEGVVGADAIFACLGPALEIFSRYSHVEKASGESVALKEYLEHVWAAVSREALSSIFAGASTEGFESDGDERIAHILQCGVTGAECGFGEHHAHTRAFALADRMDARRVMVKTPLRLLGGVGFNDEPAHRRIPPGELHAGGLADHTASAVAADEIFRAQRLAVGECHIDARVVLHEARHLASAKNRHAQLLHPLRQDALGVLLLQPQRVVVSRGQVADVQRDVKMHGRMFRALRAEPLGNAALIEDLEGARVQAERAGGDALGGGATLDEGDIDAGEGEFGGEHEAGGAGAGDEHCVVGHGCGSCRVCEGRRCCARRGALLQGRGRGIY